MRSRHPAGIKGDDADLAAFRDAGWDIDLAAHVRRGGRVLGICGGLQMLGRRVADPDGIEGAPGEAPGLGLLDVETVLTSEKRLDAVSGRTVEGGVAFRGYEMHVGATRGADTARPLLRMSDGREDGAQSRDGRVVGVYVHGLFASDDFRRTFLAQLGAKTSDLKYDGVIEDVLDRLGEHLARHLDLDRLLAIAQSRGAARDRPS